LEGIDLVGRLVLLLSAVEFEDAVDVDLGDPMPRSDANLFWRSRKGGAKTRRAAVSGKPEAPGAVSAQASFPRRRARDKGVWGMLNGIKLHADASKLGKNPEPGSRPTQGLVGLSFQGL
jgi:hypothetical protein